MATRNPYRFIGDFLLPDEEEPPESTGGGGGEMRALTDPTAPDGGFDLAPRPGFFASPQHRLAVLESERAARELAALTGQPAQGRLPRTPAGASGQQGERGQDRPGVNLASGGSYGPSPLPPVSPSLSNPLTPTDQDVQRFLAGGRSLEDRARWYAPEDKDFLAATEAEARRQVMAQTTGINLLNPIQRAILANRIQATAQSLRYSPTWTREYARRTFGYDPQTGQMVIPQGFDPNADPGFLAMWRQRQATAADTGENNALPAPSFLGPIPTL